MATAPCHVCFLTRGAGRQMKRAFSFAVTTVLAFAVLVLGGCGVRKTAVPATPSAPAATPATQSAQLVSDVKKIQAGLKIAQAALPTAQPLLADLQILDQAAYNAVAPFAAKLPGVYSNLIAACDAYLANPGANTYQAIVNGFAAFSTEVDSANLSLVGIKSQTSQGKARAIVAIGGTAIGLYGLFLQAKAIGAN